MLAEARLEGFRDRAILLLGFAGAFRKRALCGAPFFRPQHPFFFSIAHAISGPMLWRNSRGRPLNAPAGLKLVIAILLFAVPVFAQAQSSSAPKVNKGDAQKVATIISGDKAKTQTYCDMKKLGEQIDAASANKDSKTVNELTRKIVTLEKTLGPEYLALMDGFEDISKYDQLGEEFESAIATLDRLCTR
jgi:hypothetical protein